MARKRRDAPKTDPRDGSTVLGEQGLFWNIEILKSLKSLNLVLVMEGPRELVGKILI